MTIYARQVEPEFQESPLFFGEWPEGIVVRGNKRYAEHTTDTFDKVLEVLNEGELADILEDIVNNKWYKDTRDAITEYLPPKRPEEYNHAELILLTNYMMTYPDEVAEGKQNKIICDVLCIVTGKEWDYGMVAGCCQGEWNNIWYQTDTWGKSALEAFEVEYFNNGTEWIVHDEEDQPEDPEDISGYSVYCISFEPRKEIAGAAGVSPEDVVLYEFDGYKKIPKYNRR